MGHFLGVAEEAPRRPWRVFLKPSPRGIVSGLLLLAAYLTAFPHSEAGLPQPFDGFVAADIFDGGDPSVSEASTEAILVQWGTRQPYTGEGMPGVNVRISSEDDVVGWTLVAWANATQPPPTSIRFCQQDGVHFSQHDWIFQADNSGGTFETIPTTVPQRMGPNGDQCPLRVESTGVWRVTVCIEGEPVGPYDQRGPPRGIYDAPDGKRHVDIWDRCIEKVFQVG